LNMFQELQIFAFVCTYSDAGSDFGITPVDDITKRDHLSCVLLPHSTFFILRFLEFVLFIGYCFGEIMCIWDSYVYQKVFFVFLMMNVTSGRLKSIVLSVRMLRFQYNLKLSLSSTLDCVYF
jgi:hypothetical protein